MRKTVFCTILIVTLTLFSQLASGQSWNKLATSNPPPHRVNHSAVYDPVANRMIVFGGKANINGAVGVIVNDLWSLDLTTLEWQEIIPTTGPMPAPRFTHNAVFDSARNRMILWSGQGTGGQFYNDVWALNFSDTTWEQLWANGNVTGAPNQRYGTAAQFDPVARRLINVSGFTTEGRFPDTWAFQVDSLSWHDETFTAMSLHPLKRCLHSSCFAEDRRSLFLYGGQSDGIPYLNDLWILNIDTFEWIPHLLPGSPVGRHFTSIAYDGKENLYIFGGLMAGELGAATPTNELWRLSLTTNTWGQLHPPGTNPATRYGHSAVYVPTRNSMLIFAGMFQNNVRFNDVWELQFSSLPTHVGQAETPQHFQLSQNYPNPFNPTTTLEFQIARSGLVTLRIFDILGREIAVLINEHLAPGSYTTSWKADANPSGVYYYQLEQHNRIATRSMILLK